MHIVESAGTLFPGMFEKQALAEQMVHVAADLVVQVHDLDKLAIEEIVLGRPAQELIALTVALAAMVPDDVPIADLLAWTERAIPYTELKVCLHCRQAKPVGSFSIDRSRWDGRRHSCRRCHSQMRRTAA